MHMFLPWVGACVRVPYACFGHLPHSLTAFLEILLPLTPVCNLVHSFPASEAIVRLFLSCCCSENSCFFFVFNVPDGQVSLAVLLPDLGCTACVTCAGLFFCRTRVLGLCTSFNKGHTCTYSPSLPSFAMHHSDALFAVCCHVRFSRFLFLSQVWLRAPSCVHIHFNPKSYLITHHPCHL